MADQSRESEAVIDWRHLDDKPRISVPIERLEQRSSAPQCRITGAFVDKGLLDL
jgi:hypothetical protein